MKLDAALRKGFRLGDWIVRPIEGVVVGAEESRHLQPKTMDVLVCLAAHPGQVVTRDEIIDRVWGGSAVSDEPLTRCIHEIRRALGDQRDGPGYIKTIPKRGYQLLADVSELTVTDLIMDSPQPRNNNLFWQVTRQRVLWVGAIYALLAWVFVQVARFADARATAELVPPDWLMPALVIIVLLGFPIAVFYAWVRQLKFDAKGELRDDDRAFPSVVSLLWSRRGIDIVLVTMVIAVLAGFAFDMVPLSSAGAEPASRYRIAVMPFAGQRDSGEVNWLGKGVAEDLRNRLSAYEPLAVSGSSSSFRASLQGLAPQQLGRELNVQYILQGVVVRGPSQLSINARMVDAVTGLQLWSGAFRREADELFEIQAEIVQAVTNQLDLAPNAQNIEAGQKYAIQDIAAYDSYLRGRDLLREAADAESMALAAAWFQQALSADEKLAVARVGLCQAFVGELELSESDWAYGRANQACTEAILQSPGMIAAHIALADFYRVTGDAKNAVDEYRWVTDQRPENADAWFGLAQVYWQDGAIADSEQAFSTLLRIEPDGVESKEVFGQFLMGQGRYTEALVVARDLVRLDRDRIEAYEQLAMSLFMTGEFEGAIQASRQILSRDLERHDAIMTIGLSYHYLGKHKRARDIYRQAAKIMPQDHEAMGGLAIATAQLESRSVAGSTSEAAGQLFLQARTLAEQSLAERPADALTLISLAHYCAVLGDQNCAELNQARALSMAPNNIEVNYRSAVIYAALGNREAASNSTQQALALGYPQVLLLTDPLLADLWSGRSFATARIGQLFKPDY